MEVDADVAATPRRFGRAMADLFHELGYDEGDLHADTFEWLFGLPSMRIQAFLDWFLTSIRARQSVKRQLGGAQDYALYTALLRGEVGNGMLTGEHLVRAEMACQIDLAMQTSGGDDDSLDSLDADNAKLEREIQVLENKLRLANEKNDRLAKLVQRRTLTVDHQTQRLRRQQNRDHFNEVLIQITSGNRRVKSTGVLPDEILAKVQATIRHLATPAKGDSAMVLLGVSASNAIVAAPSMETLTSGSSSSALSLHEQARQWKDFLYQHSLERLEAQEERNLHDLQSRIPAIAALVSIRSTVQQEFDNSGDVMMSPALRPKRNGEGRDMPPPSPWLHESDPMQLNMREQDTLLYNKCCVELERHRKAFVVGEQDALLAQLQITRYESHWRQLTTSRRQLIQQFQLMSRDAIWARKQILLASLEKTKKQLGELFQRAFPEKLGELAFLKSTSILLQSYEQKLWRQENRFLKLRNLLEGFEMQHARLRLIHRLLDSERRDLLQIEASLQQLISLLQEYNQHTELRLTSYDQATGGDAARKTLSQTYLHEHDDVAHKLFELGERLSHEDAADGVDEQMTSHSFRLRTFDELVRLCESRCANKDSLVETTGHIQTEWKRLYDSMRRTLSQLRNELFGDATSSTPMLLPTELAAALRQANETKDEAEQSLEKSLEALRLHKRSVQVDPSKRMQQERDILRLKKELEASR